MSELLSPQLRSLVSQSVAVLGRVIQRESGQKAYDLTEKIRQEMASLRDQEADHAFEQLKKSYAELAKLNGAERREMASSFTLMLELMNTCENAYRSHRLNSRHWPEAPSQQEAAGDRPEAIIYVLTAHPTEARAPQNIAIFHEIQTLLMEILNVAKGSDEAVKLTEKREYELRHLLEVAWRTAIVRDRAPKVKDEAEHIYTTALREDILKQLLELGRTKVPFYLRSWVGGDKDGHPGVDEKTLIESLTLSRGQLLSLVLKLNKSIISTLEICTTSKERSKIHAKISAIEKQLRGLRKLESGDAKKLTTLRKSLTSVREEYAKEFGVPHPAFRTMKQVFHVFPGLCVPLELRESSDVLKSKPEGKTKLAIDRMLATLANLSKGGEPKWYARGFIISMTRELEDIQAAAAKCKKAFGSLKLPIVPLFEEAGSLANSESIVKAMLEDPQIRKAASDEWGGLVELMVGYSDSSKEAGVLASRLAIAKTLPQLEKVCKRAMLQSVFFHGSGGSIDRGGGSIEDQTAWWPRSALRRYKVTVQGEMVERALATPQIARGQIENILESATKGLTQPADFTEIPALEKFAAQISKAYRTQVGSAKFLELIEKVTPYSYLSHLKIGSRPTKRTTTVSVSGLRAIPWILCWTQTRVLFPTWWGVGTAWDQTSSSDRGEIQRAFREEPVFTSYIKALGFTLAKIELPVWRMYLEQSTLSADRKKEAFSEFADEFAKTMKFFKELTGHDDVLWFRPWLKESIRLRSPMIHPLNLLQLLSQQSGDTHLLRVTVTGISSGMMTTG
jgi:phosphoenolpyruvate carboxylase